MSEGDSFDAAHKRAYEWLDVRACKRDDQQCADDCRSQCIFKLVFIVDFDDGSAHLLSDRHCNIIACKRQSEQSTEFEANFDGK